MIVQCVVSSSTNKRARNEYTSQYLQKFNRKRDVKMSSQQIRTARIAKELKQINSGTKHHGEFDLNILVITRAKVSFYKIKDSAASLTMIV